MLEPVTNIKVFTKQDLKDGMVVEYKNGTRRLVLNNKVMGQSGFIDLEDYTDTLEYSVDSFSINKIYISRGDYLTSYFSNDNLMLIWDRDPVKEMTIQEIEEALGYKIKIKTEIK